MAGHDVIVIGASAGGIEALRVLVQGLPPTLEGSVFVVLHLPQGVRSNLPEILSRSSALPAVHPEDGQAFQRGTIYVAPPDRHMMLDGASVRLVLGPHHNRHRPAVDPLFQSAARSYGSRVIGVVLSGTLDDGTAGMMTIKTRGGITIVQDPKTALYPGMPRSVQSQVPVDHCLKLEAIGPMLARLVREPASATVPAADERLEQEFRRYLGERFDMNEMEKPSVYACPECHGSLWESDDHGILKFRCRVGHSYTSESLLAEHDTHLEASLWAGLRALEENASLRRRMAERMRSHRLSEAATRYEEQARESEDHATHLRALLTAPDSQVTEIETRA